MPFYRNALADAGVDQRAIRGAADLAQLPVVEKSILQADPTALRSTALGESEVVVLRTSGTTGRPIAVAHDRDSFLRTIAWTRRETAVLREHGVPEFGGTIVSINNPVSTARQVDSFFARSVWRPGHPKRHFVSSDAPVADVLRAIAAHRPDLIVGYGSYLELLLRTAVTEGGLEHPPKVVRYGADTLTAETQSLAERELGVPVVSVYAAAEALRLGFTCSEGGGFHVHEDLVHVATCDADGRLLADGEHGELVVSNLVNRATVLLNYRIGDTGRVDRSPCACGRTFARIVDFGGRVSEVIHLPGGAVVFTDAVYGCIKHRPEIVRFRLVEDEPSVFQLLLRVVGDEPPDLVADIATRANALLAGARVTVRIDASLGDGEAKFAAFRLLPVTR